MDTTTTTTTTTLPTPIQREPLTTPEKCKCRVAIDVSGSVSNNAAYWASVKTIVTDAVSRYGEDNVIFILWGTRASVLSYNEVQKNIISMRSHGGTDPTCFANNVMLPTGTDLIIITDGGVSQSHINTCDNIVNNRYFSNVIVHIKQTRQVPDLSISAPFTRNANYVEVWNDNNLLVTTCTSDKVNLTKYYNNPQLLVTEAKALIGQIVMQNLGKVNSALCTELVDLEKNLMDYVTANNSVDANVIKSIIKDCTMRSSGSLDFSFGVLEPTPVQVHQVVVPVQVPVQVDQVAAPVPVQVQVDQVAAPVLVQVQVDQVTVTV